MLDAKEHAEEDHDLVDERDTIAVDFNDDGGSPEGEAKEGEVVEAWYSPVLRIEAVSRAWQCVCPILYRIYVTADYIGEKVADAFGITESRFQYVIDEHNRRADKKKRKEEQVRQRLLEEREKRRANGILDDPLEQGPPRGDDDAAMSDLRPMEEFGSHCEPLPGSSSQASYELA
ncbi:hypothetical protein DIPPA_00005 [Diplonema papillatum]|nr:hypothetical protein DIPPA_07083 [Diplonema papillatum]KAJ9465406.1 hypothetical protein DIPPA_00005 [Diplonema papillatum]